MCAVLLEMDQFWDDAKSSGCSKMFFCKNWDQTSIPLQKGTPATALGPFHCGFCPQTGPYSCCLWSLIRGAAGYGHLGCFHVQRGVTVDYTATSSPRVLLPCRSVISTSSASIPSTESPRVQSWCPPLKVRQPWTIKVLSVCMMTTCVWIAGKMV